MGSFGTRNRRVLATGILMTLALGLAGTLTSMGNPDKKDAVKLVRQFSTCGC